MKRLLVGLLALSHSFQLPLSAQSSHSSGDLAAGIRQVDEGDLEAAVITLDGVVHRLSTEKGRETDLATAHLYLGLAHLGLSQMERAKANMREAWKSDRDRKLDPKKFPPRAIQLYEEAKAEARKEQATSSAASKPAPPKPQPSPSAAAGSTEKKGGSKAPLIILGVAAVGGGVALAAGKGSSAPPTTLTSATTTLLAVSGTIRGAAAFSARFMDYEATTSRAGTVEATLTSVSPSTAVLGLVIYSNCNAGNVCDEVSNTSNPTARAISASLSAGRIVLRVHDFPGRNTSDVTFALTVTLR